MREDALLAELGVEKTHSRSHVSNDNPFSEPPDMMLRSGGSISVIHAGSPSRPPTATAYLTARTHLGVKFGLETPRALVEALGRPDLAYPSLLVAGTNGKGSVVAYVDAALCASGLRVGRYTSPHLISVRERITVSGGEISRLAFETAVRRVRLSAEDLVRSGRIRDHPTFFEVLTLAAFEHFRRVAVDVAVLEVGMGGRLDATNVAEPVASAIVTIDRDHETYLGNTLPAIAREKAGVLRPGRTTILGRLPEEEGLDVVRASAERVGARLVDALEGTDVRSSESGWEIRTPERTYRGIQHLPGLHQQTNAIVALRLLETALYCGIPFDPDAAASGIARTRWPGRLQWIDQDPPLLLDGAHNPAAARALAVYLRDRGPFVLLFGVMADKDIAGLAQELFPIAQSIVLTRPRVGRAATPDQIAVRGGALASGALREASSRKALDLARRLARPGCPVVVTGSLFLVGEILKIVQGTGRRGAS